MDPTVHIIIKDVDKRRDCQVPGQRVVWHPLEQFTGYTIVKTVVDLLFDEVTLLFQGIWGCKYCINEEY